MAGQGEHQIRYGFDYENLDFSQLQQYSGPTFTAPTGQQTATGAVVDIIPDPNYSQIYHVNRASLTAARATTQHYTALFGYDTFSELRFGVPNADFGLAGVSNVVSGQQLVTPRQFRVGLRYEF